MGADLKCTVFEVLNGAALADGSGRKRVIRTLPFRLKRGVPKELVRCAQQAELSC